jgi:hypothetical protein
VLAGSPISSNRLASNGKRRRGEKGGKREGREERREEGREKGGGKGEKIPDHWAVILAGTKARLSRTTATDLSAKGPAYT